MPATMPSVAPSLPRNLVPATEAQIGTLLVMLAKAGFSYPAGWDQQSVALYINALSDIPLDLLQSAVDEWIRVKEDWYPRPGQLRALIAEDLAVRRKSYALALEDRRERSARAAGLSDAEIAERRRIEREEMAREYGFADFAAMAKFGVARAILARLGAPRGSEESAERTP